MGEIWSYLTSHDSGPWALLGLGIVLILTGVLVPRYIYKQQVRETEYWRKAYELEREARAASVSQTEDLLEMARTSNAVQNALFTNSQRPRRTGEPRVDSKNKGN